MAKKTKFELDDFGFDDDLEIPDFGSEFSGGGNQKKKDRSPVMDFGRSAISGAKSSLADEYFIRKTMKKALPRGYGEALDLADEAHSTLKSLYNDTAKELKPVLNDLKRTTKRIMPAADKILPKSISSRLNRWADSTDKGRAGFDEEAAKDAQVGMELGNIFGPALAHQIKSDAERDAKTDAREEMKMGMEHKRHVNEMGQLDAIRQSVQQLSAYQNKVTVNYQRKSLELQFRSFFLQRDQFVEQKKFNETITKGMEAVVRNTGLPDYQKLTEAENIKQIMRNKFIDAIDDSVFGQRRQFLGNLVKSIKGTAMGKVRGFADNIRAGLDSADFMLDAQEQMKEMSAGMDGPKESITGAVAGGVAGGWLQNMVLKGAKKIHGKVNQNEKLVRGGNNAAFAYRNLPTLLQAWARGDGFKEDKWYDKIPVLSDFIKESIRGLPGQDRSTQTDRLRDMMGPAVFTNKVSKSITEIIPGYLSRIFRELQVLRTGDESIQLTTYDHTNNKWGSVSGVRANQFSQLISKHGKQGLRDDANAVADLIDPHGKMSEEARKALAKQILNDNLSGTIAPTQEHYGDMGSYSGDAGHHAFELSERVNDYFKDDTRGDKKNHFGDAVRKVGQSVGDARALVQDLINVGQQDFLIEAGILSADGSMINIEKLYDYHLYDDYKAGTGEMAVPGGRKQGKKLKLKQTGNNTTYSATPTNLHASITAPAPTHSMPSDYQGQFREVIAAIKEGNARDLQTGMAETLLRIEEELKRGLIVYEGQGDGEGANTARKSFFNRSLAEHGNSLFGLGKRVFDKARGYGMANARRGRIWGNMGLRKVRKAAGKVFDYAADKAVYIKGQMEPVLTEAKLKAGLYRDEATGKIIKSWDDIKGAVIDEETGKVVIKVEDLKDLVTRTGAGETAWRWGERAYDQAKKALNFGKNQLGILTGMARRGARGIYGVGMDLATKAWKMIDGPQDVYCWSEGEPKVLEKKLAQETMQSGGYSNRSDSSEIHKPSDINGAVYDYRGVEVITQEDFNRGLYDKEGRKITTGVGRILGAAKGLLQRGLGIVKGMKDKVTDFFSGKFKGIADWFKSDGLVFSGSKTMVDRLTEIRDILDNRLPKRKGHVVGDVDGDGIREGSYQDQENKKKDGDKQSIKDRAAGMLDGAKQKGLGIYGSAAGLIGSLLKRKGKKKDDDEEGKQDDGTVTGSTLTDTVAGEAAAGLGKRALGMGKRLGKGALKGAWGLGKFGLTRALPWLVRGGIGAATAIGEAGVGGLVAGGGALLSGALSVAGATLGAVAGALSLPAVAIGVGLAAAAYGGYKLYKYLSRTTLTDLSKLRYIQYGFSPDDSSHANAVFGFEDKLKKLVSFSNDRPKLDEKGIKMEDILPDFDIDKEDKEAVANWFQWYTQRFKPVFMVHMFALNKAAPDKSLDDGIEKMKPEEKKKYLEIAKYLEGPYTVTASPFKDLPGLATTGVEVKNYVDTLTKQIDDEIAKNPKDQKAAVAAAAGSAAAAGAATVAGAQGDATQAQQGAKDLPGAGLKNQIAKAGTVAGMGLGVTSAGAMVTMSGSFDAANVTTGARLDALSCIRFKTYGLKDMEIPKVKALMSLENVTLGDVKVDAQKVATWSGDIDKITRLMAPAFGVSEPNSRDGMSWQGWFNLRFLPTYLNYLTAIFRATGKDKPADAMTSLKPQDALDAAQAIMGSHSNYQGNTGSVWQVTLSPWPNYDVNSDVATTKENVDGLRDATSKQHLEETVGLPGMDKDSAANKSNDPNAGPQPTSAIGKAMNSLFGKGSFLGDTARGVWEGTKSAVNAVSNAVGGGNVFQPSGGGAAVDMSLKGTGGLAEKLPDPKGKGTWDSMKDLIIGASKMVGVDPGIMGTMAAIESGFDPNAGAKTSSAKGLYQFLTKTWNGMIRDFGGKYGIPADTPPSNPKANALMGAEYIKQNANILTKALKRPLTATDIYAAHFLGPTGAIQLLSANPNQSAPALMPGPAAANKSIFYEGNRPRTVGEVIQYLDTLVKTKGQKFGVATSGSQALVSTPTATNPSGTSAAGPVGQAATGAPSTTATTPATQSGAAGASPQTATPGPGGSNMPASVGAGNGPQDTTKTAFDKTPQQSPVTAPAGAQVAPVVPAAASPAAAMGQGFAPSQMAQQDMAAQQQYQRSLQPDLMKNTEGLLAQQLTTQQGILEAVNGILKLAMATAGTKGASDAQTPAANDPAAVSQAVQSAQLATPTALPQSKVSMRKRDWATVGNR
jgi:hypothetical protein